MIFKFTEYPFLIVLTAGILFADYACLAYEGNSTNGYSLPPLVQLPEVCFALSWLVYTRWIKEILKLVPLSIIFLFYYLFLFTWEAFSNLLTAWRMLQHLYLVSWKSHAQFVEFCRKKNVSLKRVASFRNFLFPHNVFIWIFKVSNVFQIVYLFSLFVLP